MKALAKTSVPAAELTIEQCAAIEQLQDSGDKYKISTNAMSNTQRRTRKATLMEATVCAEDRLNLSPLRCMC